jgi:3-isopropylmalate/(R)-2-methylmalate dehydratase large subunit
MIQDHFTPNKDIKSAELNKTMRCFAREHQITHYYELGRKEMGIEHVILPDNGIVLPGDLVIGADSHTCTYGALGSSSTGVGSTDLACAMARGVTWFKVPDAIKINLTGHLNKFVTGKDLILYIIGKIGVDGALYKTLEFAGEGIKGLSMDGRLTVCNMAIECGAKNGIFPVDEITLQYISKTNPERFSAKDFKVYTADEDAEYSQVIDIDLADVPLTVALPHLPSNTRNASDCTDMKIDQVVIGSCTNGRLEDIATAVDIFKGHKVNENVRCIVIPGSQKVYRQALDNGWLQILDDAGCVISTPTCGPCLGGHMGVLAKGERCVSTTNRNFVGRMGDVESEVILSGVPVAASSAILGRVGTPDEL